MLPRLSISLLLLGVAANAAAQDAGRFFQDNCAMCHTIGGGSAMAPDLKDISKRRTHDWLLRFIQNPELAAKTDADAATLVKRFDGAVMPAIDGTTPEIVEALVRYIDSQSGAAVQGPAATARVATAVDLAAGHALYEGRQRLEHGGPACVSCHSLAPLASLGGGTLGPDLTPAAKRLGQTPGLSAWLSNPPTRVMHAVFQRHPLTTDETFAIAAMLDDTGSHTSAGARPRRAEFAAYAVALACALLAAMAFIWRDRIRAVRRPLVDAARGRTGGGR